jgi:molybdopterin converting factor subunit 1
MLESKSIMVKYFASLREKAKKNEELIETQAKTPSQLYSELCNKYGFDLPLEDVKAAVNGDFEEMVYLLKNGDSLAFIPPMSGG